ncbi:SDR family oxidoreductase [Patulibacter americanus]|uniref:SDR family oxidoreductase n=1 Tax=Patulibacter americanus TaxID=588672 RepID=UPI0003B78B6B|nr:SDR family oxidoreductase [Patulibacter americanus]
MRVLVTGASGHIGSAVVPELLGAGHEVVGLARSDRSAAALEAAGAEVLRGDLDDLDGLGAAAARADGVIHLAFKHEAMFAGDYAGAIDADLRAIEAIGGALAGSDKAFVNTAGSLSLGLAGITDRAATEDDVLQAGPRIEAENAVIALADRGVRSVVIRLAPLVHSTLDTQGFGPTLIRLAREQGAAAYVGDGANRWPAVHTRDAARLYRLAVESAPAGSRLHGVADEGIAFREIAETIGRQLGLPAQSVAPEEAGGRFSFLAGFAQVDNPMSSARTQELTGWRPTHPGLIADLEEGHYFAAPAGAEA